MLLDRWWSLFEHLCLGYGLVEFKVGIDAAEGYMEEPRAKVEHNHNTDVLIFRLKKRRPREHEDPTEKVNTRDQQLVLKAILKVIDIHCLVF